MPESDFWLVHRKLVTWCRCAHELAIVARHWPIVVFVVILVDPASLNAAVACARDGTAARSCHMRIWRPRWNQKLSSTGRKCLHTASPAFCKLITIVSAHRSAFLVALHRLRLLRLPLDLAFAHCLMGRMSKGYCENTR